MALLLGILVVIFVVYQLFYNGSFLNSEEINIVCDDDQFRNIIVNMINGLDDSTRYHLRNTSIVLLDEPPKGDKAKVSEYMKLLGMHRSFKFQPDKIELYKDNILLFAEKPGYSLQQCVESTLLHEIGHHFGFDHKKLNSLGL